jgi:hypothetical protein
MIRPIHHQCLLEIFMRERALRQPSFMLLVMLLLSMVVAACSPGHSGSSAIAFLRNGQLWRIDADGSNAFEIAAASTPVIGFAWSPSHEILFFRTLDPTFAKSTAGQHLTGDALTGLYEDAPGELDTIGINGGSPIAIQFSNATIAYSNAWWNAGSTHLLYRESFVGATSTPDNVQWWLAQSDQPGGIARKFLPYSFSMPSIAPDNSLVAGISKNGIFTTTLTGTNLHDIVSLQQPRQPIVASMERVLWQPSHQHAAFLYVVPVSSATTSTTQVASMMRLLMYHMNGQTQMLVTCACTQFAWSPDGNNVLFQVGSHFTILNIVQHVSFTFKADNDSVPYWSPDSHFLLLDGGHTLRLINVSTGRQQVILKDTVTQQAEIPAPVAGVDSLLQPVSNNLWAADSRHFIFLTRNRLLWQGKPLQHHGIYAATIDAQGQIQGQPTLIDAGHDTEAGWSYEDANTSFVY